MLDKRIRVLSNRDVEFNNHTLMPFLGIRVQVCVQGAVNEFFSRQMYFVSLRGCKIVLNDDLTDVATINDTFISFSNIKYFSFGAEVYLSDNNTICKVS